MNILKTNTMRCKKLEKNFFSNEKRKTILFQAKTSKHEFRTITATVKESCYLFSTDEGSILCFFDRKKLLQVYAFDDVFSRCFHLL